MPCNLLSKHLNKKNLIRNTNEHMLTLTLKWLSRFLVSCCTFYINTCTILKINRWIVTFVVSSLQGCSSHTRSAHGRAQTKLNSGRYSDWKTTSLSSEREINQHNIYSNFKPQKLSVWFNFLWVWCRLLRSSFWN